MGSLGAANGDSRLNQRKSVDLGHGGDTQLIDSQLSPPTLPPNGEMVETVPADEHFLGCTAPYDDTVPVDGEFETQIVNHDEETQSVNFDAETQMIGSQEDCLDNLETQLVDEFATQVIFDSESEETCRTEVLGAGNYSSDDESVTEQSNGGLVDTEKLQFDYPCKKDEIRNKTDNLSDELCGSGIPTRSFTSIRTASVRASGLAARTASINQSDSGPHNLPGSCRSSEQTAPDFNGLSHVTVSSNFEEQVARRLDDKVEEPSDGNKFKVGSSTVRRLFAEDANLETDSNCRDEGEEELNMAGLSYIDSQEPGDLSQANALDFVDQFLKDNLDDLHRDFGARKTAVGKSASVPCARGPQLLAANRATTKASGIFDWDDNMEDEGGGDIFCRRKDEFFNSEIKLMSRARPLKKLQSSRLDESKLSNESLDLQEKRRGLVRSAPVVKFDMQGEIGKKMKVDGRCAKRNLKDDFSAEALGESFRGQTEEICTVGLDTQLAAEAMEALCRDEGLIEMDDRNVEELQNLVENRRKKGLESSPKSTRQFKRKDRHNAEARKKSPISQRRSSRNIRKSTLTAKVNPREKTLEQDHADKLDISHHAKEGNNGKLEEKLHELGKSGGFFTPVARRTRSSVAAKKSLRAEEPNNLHRKATCAAGNGVHQVKDMQSNQSVGLEGSGDSVTRCKRSRSEGTNTKFNCKKRTRASKWKISYETLTLEKPAEDSSNKAHRNPCLSAKNAEAGAKLDESPRERSKVSESACITPTSCPTPANDASPVCVGDEYFKQSCRKNLSRSCLWKELKSLTTSSGPEPSPDSKHMRRRWRDMADVRVLYSHHLDDDTIKQQKKIAARLGASEASSISDATHFVTDKFVRTRNMLEAIASGKPVVTYLWLESCGQASCFLDEKNYILRDAKKEKEFGFSMPISLSRATQYHLLRDQKVFITTSTKPSKEIISSLVKAVGGQPIEKIGRSALRDDKFSKDVLILSCEEDYDVCLPFLEKGASVYSSELLLNGIVIQKLEYERHQLFVDNVRRTRSTVWLKKDGKKFTPVTTKH